MAAIPRPDAVHVPAGVCEPGGTGRSPHPPTRGEQRRSTATAWAVDVDSQARPGTEQSHKNQVDRARQGAGRFRNHSEYLGKYLKNMPQGEGAGQADSLVGSDREEPPSKRARSENNIDGDTGQDSLGQKE